MRSFESGLLTFVLCDLSIFNSAKHEFVKFIGIFYRFELLKFNNSCVTRKVVTLLLCTVHCGTKIELICCILLDLPDAT